MVKIRCLLIEDNKLVSETLSLALLRQNLEVDVVRSAEDALYHIRSNDYDIILLDLILPGMSGEEFIKFIRQENDIPILVISEKSSDISKAISLEIGADDYITKPVYIVELIARIKAILRRTKRNDQPSESYLEFHGIRINLNVHEVLKGDQSISLTVKEYDLLKLFFENPNNVLSKSQIYRNIWREELYGNDNIINVHIRRLREKIEDDPKNPSVIETVWGVGYRLGKLQT